MKDAGNMVEKCKGGLEMLYTQIEKTYSKTNFNTISLQYYYLTKHF